MSYNLLKILNKRLDIYNDEKFEEILGNEMLNEEVNFKTIRYVYSTHSEFDYFSNEKKRVMNLFDYYTGDLNKHERMNLVIEDGSYATKEEIELRKKRFVKYADKSNLWQGVISFNNDYLNENISLNDLEQELIKTVIPRLFKKMGFKDKKNMAYNLSIHTDTDNLHVHFSFIEKKPNYILLITN